ncbi:MAG TPA: chemotaxis protein CheB [Candidatus Baltobacteraceae bacterium]|nr:chemotaxis protein CheB [Candidatus Baltobacteraceae bacterium]
MPDKTEAQKETGDKRLVVVGSSAGGIEALSTLLGSLSSDFPAPVVIAQHLDPRVTSSLPSILAKRTSMSVVSVTDHQALHPGTAYLVPANKHVEIEDGHVSVRSDGAARPKPSVDLLFSSAARAYGDRLIAVVLTGMGNDGTAGVRTVKDNGGTVVIEDPATATFPSMPASLPASMVDVIASIDRVGKELEILLDDRADIVEDGDLLEALLKRVQQTNGIDFGHYKPPTIKRRLARQIKTVGLRSLAEYVDYLDRTPGEYERLVGNFLIKVTEFFRDPEFFTLLQNSIIPELVNEARSGEGQLRMWSAGCSTGEEAYSLAIAVCEVLGADYPSLNVRIFATDIDDGAIAVARRGVYAGDALMNLHPDLVKRYFTETDGRFEVNKTIRDMTVFGQHDLAQRAPFPRIDLVLCRNVLIYFSKELQQRTLHLFAFSLRNGGYLALGKAESGDPLAEYFTAVDQPLRVFRRSGERVAIPIAPNKQLPQRSVYDTLPRARPVRYDEFDSRRKDFEEAGSFLMDSAVGFVAVNDRYDVSIINGAARQMLSVHGIAVGEDLIHLVPQNVAPKLRALVDAALSNDVPTAGGTEIDMPGDDELEARCLSISGYTKRAREGGHISGVAILIVDVTAIVRSRLALETAAREQAEAFGAMQERESQWQRRRRALLEANHQLVEVNAELRERVDRMLIASEESTAATEEIETLNEEMQATNEELETLNEESQATIEELNTTTDELEARTADLQELLISRENQRIAALESKTALQAMLDTIQEPIAAIAASGEIAASNEAFRRLRQSANDASVQISDESKSAIAFSVVLRRAAKGERFSFTYEAIAADQTRSAYRGAASQLDGDASGAILTFERIV